MLIPDDITQTIALQDQYFDLKKLKAYSTFSVPTLRDYIRKGKLPAYKVGGKIVIKRSEFDAWIETHRMNKNQDLDAIVEDVMTTMKDCESN